MIRLTIDVVNPKEQALFLAILETFKNQNIIQLRKKEVIAPSEDKDFLPGEPMTQEQLDAKIEAAEESPLVSYEEARKYFEVK